MAGGAGRVRVRSVRVRGRSGEDFSNSCGCGAGADKIFQPVQDSSVDRECYVALRATVN